MMHLLVDDAATDLISWALDNWAQGAVVATAAGLLGLLIRVHGVASSTFDATRERLEKELGRIEGRNERLESDIDEIRERERVWARERLGLEATIASHERTIATLRVQLGLVRAEVRLLQATTQPPSGGTP